MESYSNIIRQYIIKKMNKENILDNNIKIKLRSEKIKIACILDEFSYECFKYESEFVQLSYRDWKNQLTYIKPHFFFVEAAWEGVNKEWINKISNLNITKDKTLSSIVKYCNDNNIPTVFWAKEDPYDFNIFIEAAKLFDFVFTTDKDCIVLYKEILNHNNVFLLPFAAQPKIHNPIDKDKYKIGKVAFAGGWYSKFPNRSKEIETILKPAFKYNLVIFDRFKDRNNNKNLFPVEYKPYIKDSLNYLDMIKEYKKFDVFLNVNSTSTSSTTFSRRVFELLASGIPVISSYSRGIENFFNNIVLMSKNQYDTNVFLDSILGNEEKKDKISLLGIREVLNHHTYNIRFREILDKIGFEDLNSVEEGVSVITCTNRPNSLDNIINNYISQNHKLKELIIIINNDIIDLDLWMERVKEYNDIRLYKLSDKFSLGKCLNYAVDKSNYPYISKFDDDDFYGPNYLVDSVNAFKYTEAGVVGKNTVYSYLEGPQLLALRYPNQENRYCEYVAGSTLTVKKEIFNYIKFKELSRGEDTKFLMDCIKFGVKIYATDRFNHVVIRRHDISTHSWKITENEFLKNCTIIKKTNDYITPVVV